MSDSRAAFNHEWVVTKVRRTFSGEGYKTAVGATTLAALQIAAMKEQGDDANVAIDTPDEEKPEDEPDSDNGPSDDDPASDGTSDDLDPSEEL